MSTQRNGINPLISLFIIMPLVLGGMVLICTVSLDVLVHFYQTPESRAKAQELSEKGQCVTYTGCTAQFTFWVLKMTILYPKIALPILTILILYGLGALLTTPEEHAQMERDSREKENLNLLRKTNKELRNLNRKLR